MKWAFASISLSESAPTPPGIQRPRAVGSASQPKPHQGGPGDHPPGAGDAANRAGTEVLDPPGKLGVARRGRIDEPLDWREASPAE